MPQTAETPTAIAAANLRRVADVLDAHPGLDLYVPINIQVPTSSGDREARVEIVDQLADALDLGPADFAQLHDGTWSYCTPTPTASGTSPRTVYTCDAA